MATLTSIRAYPSFQFTDVGNGMASPVIGVDALRLEGQENAHLLVALSQDLRLAMGDHPADNIPTEGIENDIQLEVIVLTGV